MKAEPGQILFTKLSMKGLFGFPDKLDSRASEEQAVLKGFRNFNGDIHIGSQEKGNNIGSGEDPKIADLLPEVLQTQCEMPQSINNAEATPHAGTGSLLATASMPSGVLNTCELSHLEAADASGDNEADVGTTVDSEASTDVREVGAGSSDDLELKESEQNEPFLCSTESIHSPLSEFSRKNDKDVILVQGTLVHTTSDTESDSEATDLHCAEKAVNRSGVNCAVTLQDNDQNKEQQEIEGYRQTGGLSSTDKTESSLPTSELPIKEMDNTLQETGSNSENIMVGDEYSISLPAAGEDTQESGEEQGSLASSSSSISIQKSTATEKSFQLPAFFSGLRVRKKGQPRDLGESVTEIKQKDGDLAMLKLKQPVRKSHIAPDPLPKRKLSEAKSSPTLLEQLSQLLGPKNDNKDSNAVPSESGGSDDSQQTKSVQPEPSYPPEEVKPSPAESALDAFKALFTRPPKKETTADTSELEAIKRKMRHEKESLKAIFERSKTKAGDGGSDTKLTDASSSEQDDKTPGRLQTIWPPPKAKDEEEKVGLKYTEAGKTEW
uniref:Uncharacterized protein n=1 Tax=Sphaerodactylus townsendi TaxID=933632 RepID=A0ACB8G458_9SAUR